MIELKIQIETTNENTQQIIDKVMREMNLLFGDAATEKIQIEILNREKWVVEIAYKYSNIWMEIQVFVDADSYEGAICEAYLIASARYHITPLRVNHVAKCQNQL